MKEDLARFRTELIDQMGDAKRRILGALDRVFPEYERLFSSVFIATSRELLKRASTAEEFAALDLKETSQVVRKASRGRLGPDRARLTSQLSQYTEPLTDP